ncbi:MAG: hypothetical protein OHK0044_33560 [Burkholderiaceae bacterium]
MACAIVAAFCADAAAQPLARVFFTPQERAQVVAARHAERQTAAPHAPGIVRVSGVAHGGRRAALAWLDGRAVADGGTYAGFTVRVLESGVRLVGDGREYSLRAGESIDLASGARTAVDVVVGGRAR